MRRKLIQYTIRVDRPSSDGLIASELIEGTHHGLWRQVHSSERNISVIISIPASLYCSAYIIKSNFAYLRLSNDQCYDSRVPCMRADHSVKASWRV